MPEDNQVIDLALIRRIRQGDERAREELIEKYVPMVRRIASGYFARTYEFEDLVQEGLIGLLGATQSYDPDRYDVKFSSFAYLCVLRKVYNAIKRSNTSKERVLNGALSLFAACGPDPGRPLVEALAVPDMKDDPEGEVLERMAERDLRRVLKDHLSLLEYTVLSLILAGYSCSEIERAIGVPAKVVDNARTRVKLKLARLIRAYGSLLGPQIPPKRRRRPDLYFLPAPALKQA